jgi:hypothetical protein
MSNLNNLDKLDSWLNQNGVAVMTAFCEKLGWQETDKPIVNIIKSINTKKTTTGQIREHKNGFAHFQMYAINKGTTERRQCRLTTSVGVEADITFDNDTWNVSGEVVTGSFHRDFIIETQNLDMIIFTRGAEFYMLDNYKTLWPQLRKLINSNLHDEYVSVKLDNISIVKGDTNHKWAYLTKMINAHKSNYSKYEISARKAGMAGNRHEFEFEYSQDGKVTTGVFLSEKEMIQKLGNVLNVKTYGSWKKMKSVKGVGALTLDYKNKWIDATTSSVIVSLDSSSGFIQKIQVTLVTLANKRINRSSLNSDLLTKKSGYLLAKVTASGNLSKSSQTDDNLKGSPTKKCPWKLTIRNFVKGTEKVYWKMSPRQAIDDLRVHYHGPDVNVFDSIQSDGCVMDGAHVWATLERT